MRISPRLAALLVAILPICANAQSSADRAAWVGNAVQRIVSSGHWGYADFFASVVDVHNNDPSQPPYPTVRSAVTAREWADAHNPSLSQNWEGPQFRDPAAARTDFVYQVLQHGGMAGYALGTWLEQGLARSTKEKEAHLDFVAQHQTFLIMQENTEHLRQVMQEVYDLAEQYPKFRAAVNEGFGTQFGATIGESAFAIFAGNPVLANNKYLQGLSRQGTTLGQTIDDLRNGILVGLQHQNEKIEKLVTQIGASTRNPQQTPQRTEMDVQTLVTRMQERAAAEREAAADGAEMKGLRAAAFIVSTLIPDKNTGHILDATTNAVVNVHQAFLDYQHTVTLLAAGNTDQQALSGAISSVILTGNLVGIGLQLAAAFEPHRPSVDTQILKQIAQLSTQIAALHDDVMARFDRVDAALNVIYGRMSDGFNQLAAAIQNEQESIDSVRYSFERANNDLDFFESQVVQKLDLVLKQPFRDGMELCLHYSTWGGLAISRQQFTQCVATIGSYLSMASNATENGSWDSSLDDPTNLAHTLAGLNPGSLNSSNLSPAWGAKINLFLGMANAKAGYTFDLLDPNPTEWALAAHSYATLCAQNPGPCRMSPPDFLNQLISDGNNIEEDLSVRLSTEHPKRLLTLYSYLINRYRNAIDAVALEARRVRANSLREDHSLLSDGGTSLIGFRDPRFLNKVIGFPEIDPVRPGEDPTVGLPPFPATVWRQSNLDIFTSSASWPPITSPRTNPVWAVLSITPLLFDAELLGMGPLKVRYQAYWSNVQFYHWVLANGSDAGDAGVGVPTLRFFVFLGQSGARDRFLGWTQTLPFGPPTLFYAATCCFAEADLQKMAFALRTVLTQPMGKPLLPFTWVSNTENTLRAELEQRQGKLVRDMRESLVEAAKDPTSPLGSELRDVDGTVEALRGLTVFAFPDALQTDEVLRYILFGNPTSSMSRTPISPGAVHLYPPLLTSEIAKFLLFDTEAAASDQSKTANSGKGVSPNEEPTSKWPDSVVLRNLDTFRNEAPARLLERIGIALRQAEHRPDIQPMIDRELGELETLRLLRTTKRASKN